MQPNLIPINTRISTHRRLLYKCHWQKRHFSSGVGTSCKAKVIESSNTSTKFREVQ